MRRSLALIPLVLALAACGGGGGSGGGGDPGDVIAFTRNVNGFGEIWLMRPDGSRSQRLTEAAPARTYAAGASVPSWSADGTRLAYALGAGNRGQSQVAVMDADGGNQHGVTSQQGINTQPSWSPDGKRIAFARFGAKRGIAVIPAGGGAPTQLTHSGRGALDVAPAWSPDARSIAFTRIVKTDVEHEQESIYVTGANGAGLKKLIVGGGDPAWSPDGKRIVYTSIRDYNGRTCFQECTRSSEIYVANADGTNSKRLTRTTADDQSPTWSPDGHSIAFVSDRSDPESHAYEIYVMGADGKGVHRITTGSHWSTEPAWRPTTATRGG